MTDAREVAGKLTKAQREAVLDARDMMSGHGGYPFFTVSFSGDPWPQGFAEFISFRQDRLTPLGLEVRRILMSTQGQYPKTADFRHFDVPDRANRPETGREHGAVSPQFHRSGGAA